MSASEVRVKTGGRPIAAARVVLLLAFAPSLAACSRTDTPYAPVERAAVVVPLRASSLPVAEVRRARARGIAPLVAPGPGDPSSARAAAGRRVFFDRNLGAISCTRCHDPARGGAGAPIPFGSEVRLDVPALVDLGAYARFGTSGAATKLVPYLAAHAAEVGGDAGAREVAIESAHGAALRSAFPVGEGEQQASPTMLAARALEAFLASLVSPSRVDRFLAGDDAALTSQEASGFDAFFARGCVSCHDGSAFGGRKVATLGLAVRWPGDAPLGDHAEWKPRRSRRVASLRHVAYAAPYFHEGAVENLPMAVQLMATHQLGLMLADDERDAIAAFLLALAGPLPQALGSPSPEPAHAPLPVPASAAKPAAAPAPASSIP